MRRALCAAALCAACEGPFVPPPEPPTPVASLTLDPAAAVVAPGDTLRLQATVRAVGGGILTDRSVTFASTDPAVATVSTSGLVHALVTGAAQIVAGVDGRADTTLIEVARFTITSITAGGNHTCATITEGGGGAVCWGYNRYGQTGSGGMGPAVLLPTPVSGLGPAVIVAGGNHTCALYHTAPFCWGWNQSGQLGSGGPGDIGVPVPVVSDSLLVSLTLGGQHTCGLTDAGTALCWGLNADGEVGDSSSQNRYRPVVVSGALRFTALSAGGRHTCGLATDSVAYCWGANELGQLGDSGVTARTQPTPVAGGHRFVAIAAGRYHSCALTATGAAYCWGFNARHQLGTATPDSVARVPVPVDGGYAFTQVTTGGLHSCALNAVKIAFCWGYNAWGQVGDSSTTDAAAPTPVRTAQQFVTLHTLGDHTCGMAVSGRAYCWGLGGTGELGTGTFANSTFPVRVAGQP